MFQDLSFATKYEDGTWRWTVKEINNDEKCLDENSIKPDKKVDEIECEKTGETIDSTEEEQENIAPGNENWI